MSSIQPITSLAQLKLLADPRRLQILRLLMGGQASLTTLGRQLGQTPARVRHHLQKLESAGLVALTETRMVSGVVEKFYAARANGYLLQQLVLPEIQGRPVIVFSGSHDLAVELLAEKLEPQIILLTIPVGSLDGLIALRQDLAQLSGCHLLDPSGQYNVPFIHHFFPDRPMQVITLAHREQGLIIAAGNPKKLSTVADLAREDVSFVNRNPGSGTRLWFDQQLTCLGISPAAIKGYSTSVKTHSECASLIQAGVADAAIGLRAVAHRFGLDFVPLFYERYDLVFPSEMKTTLDPILDMLSTSTFRQGVASLTGYGTTHTGEQIPL